MDVITVQRLRQELPSYTWEETSDSSWVGEHESKDFGLVIFQKQDQWVVNRWDESKESDRSRAFRMFSESNLESIIKKVQALDGTFIIKSMN